MMPLRAAAPLALQAAALAVALALPAFVGANSYALFVATQLGIYTVAAIGLNLLSGYAGQVSLGHAAFVAIGAYSVALLTVDHHWSFWAAAAVGMGLAAGLGVLAALPAFRLNTWYFAFITLAFALVFEKMIVEWRWLTKGFAGVVGVPPPSAFGYEFGPRPLYYTVVLINDRRLCHRAQYHRFALRPYLCRSTRRRAGGVGGRRLATAHEACRLCDIGRIGGHCRCVLRRTEDGRHPG